MSKIIYFIVVAVLLTAGCEEKIELTPPYDLGNDPINAQQFSFVIQDEEWLYYIDGKKDDQITRTNGEVTETYEGTYARGMNLYEDDIYFSHFGDESGIFRVNKEDPSDLEQLTDIHTSNAVIVNDYLFFNQYSSSDQSKNGLYRLNLDDHTQEKLVDGMINGIQWSDGWIYYGIPSGGKVLRMLPSGDEMMELKTNDGLNVSARGYMIINDWIYFENDDRLFASYYRSENWSDNIYRMKLDGSEIEPIAQGRLGNFNESEQVIYYYTEDRNHRRLYQMKLDGSNQTMLYEGELKWTWINVVDDIPYIMVNWGTSTPEPTELYYFDAEKGDMKQFEE
ncbi:DUF5050 domain-containing protein [Evansella halocellulosilytica]|uniref:DUF5050 domain-containing protein n=1 Tax=Evansella halocellulosilytica TaxID=2011013 RepID=UPI000BB71677|nr:DUF5050 domain-containing protein [Evansella halocellulosilytica]